MCQIRKQVEIENPYLGTGAIGEGRWLVFKEREILQNLFYKLIH